MKSLYLELALWFGTAASILAIRSEVLRTSALVPDAVHSTTPEPLLRPFSDRSLVADSVSKAAEFTSDHDPFRVSHEPASTPYGTTVVTAAPAPSQPAPSLRGIVGASGRLSVILAGIPGRDGNVVLQAGDSVAGYRVRRITLSSTVIAGHDTTWTLQLGIPWQ